MEGDQAALEADSRLHQSETRQRLPASTTVPEGTASETSPLLRATSPERSNRERDGTAEGREHSPPAWNGTEEFDGLPWYRKPSVGYLILPFLVLAMTYGATMVPLVNVIKILLCRDIVGPGTDLEVCNSDTEVQAQVAMFQLYAQVLAGLLSAVSSPILGAWSDRYGRLKMLAVTSLGMLVKDACILAVYHTNGTFSVWWFLLAYAIDGACGSFTAGMAISHAYASDLTSPEKRATVFGWFHGSLFAGVAIGPLAAGYIVEYTGDLIVVFYIALGCHVFYLLSLLLAPESLSKRRQKEAQVKYAQAQEARSAALLLSAAETDPQVWSSIKKFYAKHDPNLLEPLNILWPTGPGTSPRLRRNLVILAAIDTIMFGTAMGSVSVLVLFVGHVFNWDTPETTKFVTIVNVSRVLCILVVLPIVTRLVRGGRGTIKPREAGCDTLDLSLIRVAVVFDALGFIGYALAPTGGWIIVAGVIASIGGVGSPTLQSSLTKHVPPSQVGQLLGATGLLHALARVVTPAVFNLIYARTVKVHMPATVFVVLAGCFGVAFVCSIFLKSGVYVDTKALKALEQEDERQEVPFRDDYREEEQALI